MTGETDLQLLLATMQPVLHEQPYVFCSIGQAVYAALPFTPLGMFREQEGFTVIVSVPQAVEHGLAFDTTWACITLTVHSSLLAVGFLAAIAGAFAQAGISLNAVSAYYHDHLFVPWAQREQALDVIKAMSREAWAISPKQ
ncbi:MAG: ACT domain-containing protein [Anaerolineales bacterium]